MKGSRDCDRWTWRQSWMILVWVAAAVYLYTRNIGNTFVVDEWMFIGARHYFSWQSLVAPHNGHLSIVPAIVYLVLLKVFGLGNYVVFRILAVTMQLIVCLAVGQMVLRRQGTTVAFLIATLLAVSGIGVQNSLWGFQIGFMGSVLGFILAVSFFDKFHDLDAPVAYQFLAMVCLCVALGCSGVGVPGLITFWLLVVLERDLRRSWWVVAIPSLLYASWSLRYGDSVPAPRPTLSQFASFVIDGQSGSLSGLFGVDIMWGRMAFGGLLLLVFLDIRRNGLSFRRNVWLAFSAAFWMITAFKRASLTTPLSSRYLWVGSIILILQIIELIPKHRFLSMNRRVLLFIGSVVVVLGVWGSYPLLTEYRSFHRIWSDQSMVTNSILLANRENIDPSLVAHSFGEIPLDTTGQFFEAVDQFGAPDIYSGTEILGNTDLSLIAEAAMVDLGLMDVEPTDATCADSELLFEHKVEEGSTLVFRVTTPTVVRVARFVDIQSAPDANVRLLNPGNYTIELRDDGFGLPLRVQFDNEVSQCD